MKNRITTGRRCPSVASVLAACLTMFLAIPWTTGPLVAEAPVSAPAPAPATASAADDRVMPAARRALAERGLQASAVEATVRMPSVGIQTTSG